MIIQNGKQKSTQEFKGIKFHVQEDLNFIIQSANDTYMTIYNY